MIDAEKFAFKLDDSRGNLLKDIASVNGVNKTPNDIETNTAFTPLVNLQVYLLVLNWITRIFQVERETLLRK